MIGRCADSSNIGCVDIDFDQTVRDTIEYLSDLGHTHIAFLNQSQAAFDAGYGPAVRTQQSFERAMTEAGLTGSTYRCGALPLAGYEAFNHLLKECPDLTALVTVNERALPGVMQAIADRGWRIPEDFSLVVIVSSPRVAETAIPPLTTADAPAAELGRLGAELLIQQLEAQEQSTLTTLLPCRLVVRGSTGPCQRVNEH
jgi:DNA-binding LacI/PurR family transcriptional regulator